MTGRFLTLGLAVLLCVAAGCQSASKPKDYKPTWARFFLEAARGEGSPVLLPQSGVRLGVNSKPVITEGDIVDVELVQVELGRALMFKLTPTAARDFYRLSGTHQGRRLVLVVDGDPLGARRIDGAIGDGIVYVFAEMPESALPALVENLKKSAIALQKEIAKKG
jgi:preprotein translocase subunit SecD